MPILAVNRKKPIKTISFAEQPLIVLVFDSPSDKFMFDNKWKDGSPKVSFYRENLQNSSEKAPRAALSD